MGAEVEEFADGLNVKGEISLRGSEVESYGDHRVAMAMAIAGLVAEGTTTVHGVSSVNISFPGFFQHLRKLTL
jgi:3-phosphoshikimate 1-carboxyvinyltransferase